MKRIKNILILILLCFVNVMLAQTTGKVTLTLPNGGGYALPNGSAGQVLTMYNSTQVAWENAAGASAWLLGGNTNVNYLTKPIGTTDTSTFGFIVYGNFYGYFGGTGVYVGLNAGIYDKPSNNSGNVGIGQNVLNNFSSGNNNVGIGYGVLSGITSGTNITCIGAGATVSANNLINATAIGSSATATGRNQFVLGSTAVTGLEFSGALMPFYSAAYNPGTSGQVLTSQGVGVSPHWANAGAGTVTSFTATGTTSPLLSYSVSNATTTPNLAFTIPTQPAALFYSTTVNGGGNQTPSFLKFYYNDITGLTDSLAAWNLVGNAGTTMTANFLGTTDSVGLLFRVNNINWGYFNPNFQNVSIGERSMQNNTTGIHNEALGYFTLYKNTTGNYNFGIGYNALSSNTIGLANGAIGNSSLSANTTGSCNTAIGRHSLFNNSTGTGNTGLGDTTLLGNATGTYNTGIGYNANVSSDGLTNATAIGANSSVSASNTMTLGSTAVTGVEFNGALMPNVAGTYTAGVKGNVLVSQGGNTSPMWMASNYNVTTNSSSLSVTSSSMMPLGYGLTITTKGSTNLLITWTAWVQAANTQNCTCQLYYGVGTPPVYGGSLSGADAIALPVTIGNFSSTFVNSSISISGIQHVGLYNTFWIDVACSRASIGNPGIANTFLSVYEIK